MTAKQVYRVVVLEVDAEASAEGVTPVEIETISYVAEALSPWDAVMAWSEELQEEEAS
jgi:hypothetical protein